MVISEVFGEPMPDVRMAGLVRCWKGCRQG